MLPHFCASKVAHLIYRNAYLQAPKSALTSKECFILIGPTDFGDHLFEDFKHHQPHFSFLTKHLDLSANDISYRYPCSFQ